MPWFKQRSTSNPNYAFDTVAGRYIVLCFYGDAPSDEVGRATLALPGGHRSLFDDDKLAFFGVSADPADQTEERASRSLPGIRHFWDFDGTVGRLYGALPPMPAGRRPGSAPPLLDGAQPDLARPRHLPLRGGRQRPRRGDGLLPACRRSTGSPASRSRRRFSSFPNVFEPEFCRHLIGLYEQHGGEESGFMREIDGKTVAAHDPDHKRRKDYTIDDDAS